MLEKKDKNANGGDFNATDFLSQRLQLSNNLTSLTPEIERSLNSALPFLDQAVIFSRASYASVYLGNLPLDRELALASVLNLNSVRGSKRLSGRPYATHPMQVAWIGLALTSDSSDEIRRQTALLSLVHDIFEEDTLKAISGKKKQLLPFADLSTQPSESVAIAQARVKVNQMFNIHNVGDSVVLLMEPLIPDDSRRKLKERGYSDYVITYSYFGEQLRCSGNPALIHTEIADRIDDIADLEHLAKRPISNEDKRRILLNKFAKCYFTVQHIALEGNQVRPNVSPFMVKVFFDILDYVTRENGMTMETVLDHTQNFEIFIKDNYPVIATDLNRYWQTTGTTIA